MARIKDAAKREKRLAARIKGFEQLKAGKGAAFHKPGSMSK